MTKKPRPKRPNGTIQRLAESLKISTRQTSTLLAAGMPDDVDGARKWRDQNLSTGSSDSAELLRRARLKLVLEQERRCRMENEIRAGQLVDRAQCDGEAIHIALAMKGSLMALETSLPGKLLGLRSQGEIRKTLHEEFREILGKVHRGEFFNAPGVLETVREYYPDFTPNLLKP